MDRLLFPNTHDFKSTANLVVLLKVHKRNPATNQLFYTSVSLERKTVVTHMATAPPRTTGPSKDAAGGFLMEKSQKATAPNRPPALSDTEKRNHSTFWGPKIQTDPVMPGKDLRQVLHKAPFSVITLAEN